jgi:diaminohydroxyphosphoribosylaminopyrimidine deaminase/5-amino-6-(5-phosphoribosylamino)uracil reductase
MATAAEEEAMRRAIAISAFGLGATSPNPPVGCVILDVEGHVVGEGYHRRKGESHAEVNALAAAGERARGGTAVVTLEPCNHHGRTPPCRQALIDAGISRVVIALMDPTSREEGGAARLRAAGVDVEADVLVEEARLVTGPWLESFDRGVPDVEWCYVATSAGVVADVSIPDDELQRARVRFDAVLRPHGGLEEGATDAHRRDVFSLPTDLGIDLSHTALANLYSQGVRSLLVNGWSVEAAAAFAQGCFMRATMYLESQPPSAVEQPGSPAVSFLPAEARLVSITRTPGNVCLTFVRRADDTAR